MAPELGTGTVVGLFDGGAAQKLGVGGYAIWDGHGCVLCQGKWYGTNSDTNNTAECQALVDILRAILDGDYACPPMVRKI